MTADAEHSLEAFTLRSRLRSSGWPGPLAFLSVLGWPILALALVPVVGSQLADLPFDRGAGVASIWRNLALTTLIAAVISVVTLPAAIAVGRRRPELLVALLERGVRVSLVGMALLVVLESVLIIGILLIVERALFGQAYPGSAGIVFLGAIAGAFYLLRAAAHYPRGDLELVAVELDPTSGPAGVVSDLSRRLGIDPPRHLVMGPGLVPFTTRLALRVDERTLEGPSVYLSWPLFGVLSTDEAEAIVAHELAHIVARHLETGQRLARGLRRIDTAARAMDQEVLDNQFARMATSPIKGWLRHVERALDGPIRDLGRADEKEADRLAATLVDAQVLADALIKTSAASMLAPAWHQLATDPRLANMAGGRAAEREFAATFGRLLEAVATPPDDAADEAGRWALWGPLASIADRVAALGASPRIPAMPAGSAFDRWFPNDGPVRVRLALLMRDGPRLVRDEVINPLRFEVGVAGAIIVAAAFLGIGIFAWIDTSSPYGVRASGLRFSFLIALIVAIAGLVYVGLQQEIVVDDRGISATGWLRRIVGGRARTVAWPAIRRAHVRSLRTIVVETMGRPTEVRGWVLNERDQRRVVDAVRSRGVPFQFSRRTRNLDDERRAVVWFKGDGFLIPSLRRSSAGEILEVAPVAELEMSRRDVAAALAWALNSATKSAGGRAAAVDVRHDRPAARRVVLVGSRALTTIRVDGVDGHWWAEGPPDVGWATYVIFDALGLQDLGFDDEGEDGEDLHANRDSPA